MPKVKSKRGAAKRFSITAKGKVKFKRSKLRHILTSKTTKQKRKLRADSYASKGDAKNIKKLLPYS